MMGRPAAAGGLDSHAAWISLLSSEERGDSCPHSSPASVCSLPHSLAGVGCVLANGWEEGGMRCWSCTRTGDCIHPSPLQPAVHDTWRFVMGIIMNLTRLQARMECAWLMSQPGSGPAGPASSCLAPEGSGNREGGGGGAVESSGLVCGRSRTNLVVSGSFVLESSWGRGWGEGVDLGLSCFPGMPSFRPVSTGWVGGSAEPPAHSGCPLYLSQLEELPQGSSVSCPGHRGRLRPRLPSLGPLHSAPGSHQVTSFHLPLPRESHLILESYL